MKSGIPRPIDVVVASLALLMCAPVLVLSALIVAVSSRGPVLFRQERVGRKGRKFVLYKLRTMQVVPEGLQVTAGDDDRVTPVGKLLRKMKIDELPEFWNVLKGDMSLVGPRPEVPRYVDAANSLWHLTLEVRPGITDPVTLRLRNEATLLAGIEGDREAFYREVLQPLKLEGYVEYLQARSLWSDVRVLWETAIAVVLPSKAPPPRLDELLDRPELAPGAFLSDKEAKMAGPSGKPLGR